MRGEVHPDGDNRVGVVAVQIGGLRDHRVVIVDDRRALDKVTGLHVIEGVLDGVDQVRACRHVDPETGVEM